MKRTVRQVAGCVAVLVCTLGHGYADSVTTLDRDKNSSASYNDKRETRGVELLRDKSIFGEKYGEIENIKNMVQVWEAFNGSLGDTIAIRLTKDRITAKTIDEVKKQHGEPDRTVELKLEEGIKGTAQFWSSVCLAVDTNKTVVGYGMPVAWLVASGRFGSVIQTSTGPGADLMTFLKGEGNGVKSDDAAAKPQKPTKAAPDLLPVFAKPLVTGANTITVENPNDFTVHVGLRQGDRGANLTVAPQDKNGIDLSNGKYDVYFVYSDKPNDLLQGDSLFVDGHTVRIQVTKVANGNYTIRQVR